MVALKEIFILLFVVIVVVNAAIYDPDAPRATRKPKGHCDKTECAAKKCKGGGKASCNHSICLCPKPRQLLGHCDESKCAKKKCSGGGKASCQKSACMCPIVHHIKGHCEEHECAEKLQCKTGKAFCEHSVCMCHEEPELIGGESPGSD